MTALFDAIGGERLRDVLRDFYDRVFADVMIGFMFRGKDKARLVDKEWELVAELLGGPVTYSGRGIAEVHGRLPIMGGHFERRYRILEETLADHAVPEAVREAWLAHTRALRSQVTPDAGSSCDDAAASARGGPGPVLPRG